MAIVLGAIGYSEVCIGFLDNESKIAEEASPIPAVPINNFDFGDSLPQTPFKVRSRSILAYKLGNGSAHVSWRLRLSCSIKEP